MRPTSLPCPHDNQGNTEQIGGAGPPQASNQMGRIEKLVVLGVLLVIVGILCAVEWWTPVDGTAGPQLSQRTQPEVRSAQVQPAPLLEESVPVLDPVAGRGAGGPAGAAELASEGSSSLLLTTPGEEEATQGSESTPAPRDSGVLEASAPVVADTSPLPGALLTVEGLEKHAFAPGMWTYTVQQGDTFISLARRFYGSDGMAGLLQRQNEGYEVLQIGTVLVIPQEDDGYVAPRTHLVEEGDTLWSIAEEVYGKGWLNDRILAANEVLLGGSASLSPGMRLVIPTLD